MSNTTTLLIIGAAALILGPPLFRAVTGRPVAAASQQRFAVLDPEGGPTRVPLGTVVPTPTPEPIFSTQVIGGDIVSNDFVPFGPDVPTTDLVGPFETGFEVGSKIFPFVFNPARASIDSILSIF